MTRTLSYAACAALLAVGTMPAAAFDAADYHAANCTRCHDSRVYTRPDHRVRSFAALEAQVARCDAQLETRLFPDELAGLVDFLNHQYYRFDK